MTETTFQGLGFDEARFGGLSVGVPGTVRGWETALKRYGTRSLSSLLRPGQQTRRRGLRHRPDVRGPGGGESGGLRRLHLDARALPDARAPEEGSTHRNPDMARTYELIRANPDNFYTGAIARDIAQTVQHPPEAADSNRPHDVHAGTMTTA